MIGTLWIIAVSLSIAEIRNKRVEDVLPVAFLSVILFLFPFYCMNVLVFGRILLLLFSLVLFLCAIYKKAFSFDRFTPGLIVFLFVVAIVYWTTRNNYVWLWDETRLWGAVPKILHYHPELQLGENALVYPRMQSYPPGMPLLVYFMEGFHRTFWEWEIFFVYGVFVCALMIPAVKMSGRTGWFLTPVIATAIFLIPCLMTRHGGDYCYFYNSLFIDTVLGALWGYGLHIAATESFDSVWDIYRIVCIIGVLVLLKDSGTLFAASVLVVCFCKQYIEKQINRVVVRRMLVALITGSVYYGWWQLLLTINVVKNPLGLKGHFTVETLKLLIKSIIQISVISVRGKFNLFNADFSFAVVVLLFIAFSYVLTIAYRDLDKRFQRYMLFVMIITVGAFYAGFGMTFGGGSLPSFQRYTTTITTAMIVSLFMRLLSGFSKDRIVLGRKTKMVVFVLSIVLGIHAFTWDKNTDLAYLCDLNYTRMFSDTIIEKVQKDRASNQGHIQRVYLLFPGDPGSNCLIAQRMYMNLMGSGITIANYLDNMQIIAEEDKELPGADEIERRIGEWYRMILEDYDYVYVHGMGVNDITRRAFKIATGETLVVNGVYRVDCEKGKLIILDE